MNDVPILKILFWALIVNAIFLTAWLTYQDQIFGVDSWYWARVSGFTVVMVNVSVFAFYFLVAHFFKIGRTSERNFLILSTVFLSSLFAMRILEFELDDMLLMSMTMFAILIFPKKALPIGLGVVAFYVFIHGFHNFDFWNQTLFLEQRVDFTKVLYLVPTAYLFIMNSRWSYLAIVVGLFLIFPIPKFVNTALPLLILPMLYNMKDRPIKADWIILTMLVLSFLVFSWTVSGYFVEQYADSEKLCDLKTLECDNSEVDDWWKGHYLLYKGFAPSHYPSSQNVSMIS